MDLIDLLSRAFSHRLPGSALALCKPVPEGDIPATYGIPQKQARRAEENERGVNEASKDQRNIEQREENGKA